LGLRSVKNSLRPLYRKARRFAVSLFWSYGPEELKRALRELGIRVGDSIMLHSAFEAHHGFRGTSGQLVDAFLDVLGPSGTLLMVSLPYRSSTQDYLRKGAIFDVRKTPSMMGLVSDFFRRRPGVVRSASPSHPILAYGARAEWFIEGHEHCLYPCGPGSPFAKFADVGGKFVFFNTPFDVLTFFHYLEHIVSEKLSFRLYTDELFETRVLDRDGRALVVKTHAFSKEALRRRRFPVLERYLRKHGLIRQRRIGASRLITADSREIVSAVRDMAAAGLYFYDFGDRESDGRRV
jgi:aminoglycoside 3-N-acetyltransferase